MTQLWRTSCVKYFVKLGLKLMRGIHNPLIDLKRTNLERLSNLATGMTVWKCFERKLSFEILILLCWSFCKKQKKLLMRVCAPTMGAFGTIVKNLEGDIWFISTTQLVVQVVLSLKKVASLSLLHLWLIWNNCSRRLTLKVC